ARCTGRLPSVKLLKPGGILVLDDLDFKIRVLSWWQATHSHLSERELDEYQMVMVGDLVVKQHPELEGFRVTDDGGIGWAQKRPASKLLRKILCPTVFSVSATSTAVLTGQADGQRHHNLNVSRNVLHRNRQILIVARHSGRLHDGLYHDGVANGG